MFRFEQLLKCGSGANLEIVPVFRNGIQAEGLQVHDFHGIACWFGKQSSASQGNAVRLFQKSEGFVKRFGPVIGDDHIRIIQLKKYRHLTMAVLFDLAGSGIRLKFGEEELLFECLDEEGYLAAVCVVPVEAPGRLDSMRTWI